MLKIFASFLVILSLANAVGNGQIYILSLPDDKAKELRVDGKNVKWIKHPSKKGYKFAIIAVNYKNKNDIKILNGDEEILLKVEQLPYKKEQISVENSKVNPPKSVLNRIKKERDEANKIYSTFTPTLFATSKFIYPLKSKITSDYGGARIFNGSLKSFHSGTDFRAPIGTKIQASNDGIVRISKDRYYAGGSVVIDHGGGIYTQYYHLSQILVKNGDKVKKGDIIALSGATGRVNGPHLHFGVFANGAQVDPMQFISHFNESLFE